MKKLCRLVCFILLVFSTAGFIAFSIHSDYAKHAAFYSICREMKLGEEMKYNEKDEGKMLEKLVNAGKKVMTAQFEGELEKTAMTGNRYIFPLDQQIFGCVKGTFTTDLQFKNLSYGMFTSGKEYPVLMRFLKKTYNEKEWSPKNLGVQMRFFNVEGEFSPNDKRLGHMGDVQDFLFSSERGIISHPEDYLNIFETTLEEKSSSKAYRKWYFKNPNQLLNDFLAKQNSGAHTAFSETNYNTLVAYKWKEKAAKFRLKPCKDSHFQIDHTKDSMIHNILRQLANDDICFDFFVQLQSDPCEESVDMISKTWKIPELMKLGQLKITKNTPLFRKSKCINFQFNPCNHLNAHKPLGIMGRTFCKLYSDLSHFQAMKNFDLKDVEIDQEPRTFCHIPEDKVD